VRVDNGRATDAIELGGFRDPSVITENFDSLFQDMTVRPESCELCVITLCLFLLDPLEDLEYEDLA
jgi:hypothetical protein